MRRVGLGLMLLMALVLPASAGATSAMGVPHSGISGGLYDTTCGDGCGPVCPPPCTATDVICTQTQRAIVCPQVERAPAGSVICLTGCGVEYPLYEGDGATITVRRAGSEQILRTVTPTEGRFNVPLGAGRYVLRGHVALPCWSGEKVLVTVDPGHWTIGTELQVHDGCVVHPDAG